MNETKIKASHHKIDSWKNQDNAIFYENISIETNIQNSILGGLEEGYDLNLICDYIQESHSILEVGAGYGRVVKWLIQKKYKGKIFAIERSKKLYNYLMKNYSNNAEIIHADLNAFESSKKFDVILWMFSGISDFPKNQQLAVLSKLAAHMTPKGKIILDVFQYDKNPSNAIASSNQYYCIKKDGYILYGYLPSTNDIAYYADYLTLSVEKIIPYNTPTNSQRHLYILTK